MKPASKHETLAPRKRILVKNLAGRLNNIAKRRPVRDSSTANNKFRETITDFLARFIVFKATTEGLMQLYTTEQHISPESSSAPWSHPY
ncbi:MULTISPECIES: hypothetical protein [unclassified Sinorhizobium]|uniref:hypothetical protein n=1 Tax=unclassified Sinorhizobium TaxID=2613772 RepID=UPI0024C30E87|nr:MULTISPECIES: hypothetical protein [unclassified Sinorhizobium]MDK1376418.1 hypothetical protein [Sinorhizobium sp. 6-70]MDK1479967.1 hypothetical protein [Sinorhizobium sp. 6-117]